ncbi:hypothetical protein ACQ4LE_005183, partial [Meloidogyne hapla]
MEDGVKRISKGFLHFYNATSGETVPSCDRHFTIRNAQVVCRELGLSSQNAYHWVTPQWSYNPKIRIVKTYMESRECRGNERRLEQCTLRLTSRLSDWQCMDNEHFNYIHCGQDLSLSKEFIGHWGGITFARFGLDLGEEREKDDEEGNDGFVKEIGSGGDRSILRHVEVVGGGRAHNNSLFESALQIIQRCPILENVNVTNSSMGAMQVLLPPCGNLLLSRLNISDNDGIGINILSAGLLHSGTTHYSSNSNRGPSPSILQSQHSVPKGPLNIPYQIPGFLDICSAGKEIKIKTRLIIFYKYDSFAVDCVKIFKSVDGRNIGFRFLQANFYSGPVGIPRSDKLSIYSGSSFSSSSLLRSFNSLFNFDESGSITTRSTVISIHLRATAADGEFGFLAEIATLPAVPLPRKGVDEVAIRASRILNNDRGAINYRTLGEIGPNIIIEQCAFDRNGYHLYGNISTSTIAVDMNLHNTMLFFFRANSIRYGRGGLYISDKSSSSMSRLRAVIKNNNFLMNSNASTLTFIGNGLQKADFLANLISHNYALYADTIILNGVSANFSHNIINKNVGWHVVDTCRFNGESVETAAELYFQNNYLKDNLALGHGNPYIERYGFHDGHEPDEFVERRPKRQVISQKGVSFDWWTHIGAETSRYRSTILSGSVHQLYSRNLFDNPLNDFELVTTQHESPQFDISSIDARYNYWGPPGTMGTAAGKIRDQHDDPLLIRVDFDPVLESNTSLIEGDCPAGWFLVGREEFKSCFIFIGATSTYSDAVQTCQYLDAFLPIMQSGDPRQKELAKRIDHLSQLYITELEKVNSFGFAYDIPIWIASVTIPSNQCGWMSSRTASIGEQNCHNLLPYVCERGTGPYQEPLLWRTDFLLVLISIILFIIAIVLLAICAFRKANTKERQFTRRKQFLRDSIRSSQQLIQMR